MSQRKRHIDHDHFHGGARAVLCSACNAVLGFSRESPSVLRAAADYLERHADHVDVHTEKKKVLAAPLPSLPSRPGGALEVASHRQPGAGERPPLAESQFGGFHAA